MTTCSSSLRAICLGLALLAAKASADRRPQPQALATHESLPMLSGSLSHHGVRTDDNEYDRGQEYMLAMPQSSQPSPAAGSAFGTDSYTDTPDPAEGEDADRGSWKGVFGTAPTASGHNGALHFEGPASEYTGTTHWGGADVREFLLHGLPVTTKTYESERPAELGHSYNVDALDTFRKFLEQPIVKQTYDVDSDDVFAKYLEQKPIIRTTYDLDSDSAYRRYFDQQKPIVSQTHNLDSDSALRRYFEQQKPIISQTYEMDSDSTYRKYLEQQKPILSQTYEVDSDLALRKYFEQQRPIVSQNYELDSDLALRKYFEQQRPIVSQNYELDSDLALRKYFEQQEPIVRNSYSALPSPVIKKYAEMESTPVVRKSVTILPPPVVQKLFKVMPAPVIRKYFTAPPMVQSVKASPPVFNKFVKNIFVQHPVQRQQPFVIVPPPTKNVYNLIKLAAPMPKPTSPMPTDAMPTNAMPTNAMPTNAMPTVVPTNAMPTAMPNNAMPTAMPTTAVPIIAEPTSTPPPTETLLAQEDEAKEEATEEQKLKSIGKMVVVETVRRVVDVPAFDGPAPPPARSEETVVEPDGTVRKFEKYIEYDQVAGGLQAAGVRASHSKKQAKSGYAAQVSPVLLDAAKTSTAASPGSARLLHSSTFFPDSSAMTGSPGFLSGLGSTSFDSMTRTQFAKALVQPIHEETGEESAFLTPEDDLSEQMMQKTETIEKPSEYLQLPSETVAHFTTARPALPTTPLA